MIKSFQNKNPKFEKNVYIAESAVVIGDVTLGNNVNIGQNTIITTTNHNIYDHRKFGDKKGIIIGNNVWIGANCSIVAGVKIGNNVTIGAGCVIRKNIPSNSLAIERSS